jgi:thiol:disulfide interchange protein DsbA
MKQLFVLLAASFLIAGCGNKQDAEPETPEAPPVEAEAADTAAETADTSVEEALQVVEESAGAEEASQDEPIKLAMADEAADTAAREWKFREGRDYFRLVPTQPTIGSADRIEVAEFFMYGCPHCFSIDSAVEEWSTDLDPTVRFLRVPAIFNRVAQTHAQLFYSAELLAANGALKDPATFHTTVFVEFHQRGNRLLSEDAVQKLFERFGVSAADFDKAWASFPVDQKMRIASDLVRRYGVNAVPAFVVNGKYRVPNTANVLEVIDELLVREGLR